MLYDSGVGSGTFLKLLRHHKVTSGDLFSIGKDLNFIVVVDKPMIDNTIKPQLNPSSNVALMQNMFNENQEYQDSRIPKPNFAQPMTGSGNLCINFIENIMSKQHDSCSLMSQATIKR